MSQNTEVEIRGRRVRLSNPDRVLYPATGFTKGQLVDYYRRVSEVMLPHLSERALSLKRYPDGVEGKFFWDKQCPQHRPDWVETVPIWSPTNRRNLDYCLANDQPALIWLANLAAIELHASLCLRRDLTRPTALVFDLDPGPPAGIVECARVGLWLRDILEQRELQSFPKTSGSKGLHVFVPLNTPTTFEQTKPFARALAERLEQQQPDLVVSNMKRSIRAGRILVDWSQNDAHKTTVCVYSARARSRPTVSTPVSWDEVASVADGADPAQLVFETTDVLNRIERSGDLFAPLLALKQSLPPAAAATTS